jgi:phage-related minor tail protein
VSSQNIKGIKVELDGETTGLEAALKRVNKAGNDINKELGQVERGLKFNPDSTVLLAQKQELLKEKIASTKLGLDALNQAQDRVKAMYKSGEIDDGQYRSFQRELETTKSKLKTFEQQVKDVDTAQDKANKSTSTWGDKLGKAGKGIAIAGAAAGTAIIALGTQALDNADNLQMMADKTGLSAERLQELQYVGADLGVDLETISGAQAKLTKSMNAGRDGAGAQGEAFKKLGISVTDSNGNLRDAKTVMFEAFDALGNVGNETERDALSMAIFGKSAMDLNPLIVAGTDKLKELSQQARDSGAVMSNEAVGGLDAFGDGMDHAKAAILGAIGEALSKLMPVLQPILDAFLKAPAPIKILVGVIALLGAGLAVLTPILVALTAVEWAALAPMLPIIGIVALVVAAIAALVAIVVVIIKYHKQLGAIIGKAWDAVKKAIVAAWNAVVGALKAAGKFLYDVLIKPYVLFWTWVYKNIVLKVAHFIEDTVLPALKKAATFLYNLLIKPYVDAYKWIWEKVILKIANFFTETVVPALKKAYQFVLDAITEPPKRAWEWIKTNVVDPIANFFTVTVVPALKAAWEFVKEAITEPPKQAWEWIKTNVVDPIANFFTDTVIPALKAAFQFVVDAITGPPKAAWAWIDEHVVSPIKNFFTEKVIPALEKAFNAVLDAITAPFKAAWEFIDKYLIQPVKAFFGWLAGDHPAGTITGVNPQKLPEMLGRGKIPMAASGGYVPATPGGTLVVVGEGGEGEYITPESKLGRGGMTFTGPITVVANDPRQFLAAMEREIGLKARARGGR